MVKAALSGSVALFERVQERLGPNRLPLLIAIDGADGLGKSSLASWLAWQLHRRAWPASGYAERRGVHDGALQRHHELGD